MTPTELNEHKEQLYTASVLYRLLKAEGNEAAALLLQELETASIARLVTEMNEAFAWARSRPPTESWWTGGIAKRTKILGSLI